MYRYLYRTEVVAILVGFSLLLREDSWAVVAVYFRFTDLSLVT